MAVMYDVVIKNDSTAAVMVEDLGISVGAASQEDFHEQFTFDALAGSDDLRTLVAAGTLTLNDGSSDLSAADGEDYLTLGTLEYLDDNYYTQTQLSTSGQSSVHWDNVTNAPAWGSVSWLDPILFRVIAIDTTATASAVGDVYCDTDDDKYYKWNGASWDDAGDAAEGDRVINLDETNEPIWVFSSGSFGSDSTANDADAAIIDDDGDGSAAQYVYQIPGNDWVKIADADFSGHLDGGASKHDASEIDVEGSYTYIATGDLESAIEDIDDELGSLNSAIGAISQNTLDEAYDEGGAGVGRSITVDAGAVVMDTSAATNAPLQLTAKAAAPSTGLADGQLYRDTDGILYTYDSTRAKWLSVERKTFYWGKAGRSRNQYLMSIASIASNNSGYRLMRDATIVGISAQYDANVTANATAQIEKDDGGSSIASQVVTTGNAGAQTTTTNVDVDQGSFLQAYLACANRCEDAVVVIEVAWRP